MSGIDLAGTHAEALAFSVCSTSGLVVELGAGWYSTPLLHGMCEALERPLITIESEVKWLAEFRPWVSGFHRLVLDEQMAVPENASVVLVDHNSPVVTRADSVLEAKERGAEIVVVHDTWPRHDPPSFVFTGGFQEALRAFKWRRDWAIQGTGLWWPQGRAPTSALSDVIEL